MFNFINRFFSRLKKTHAINMVFKPFSNSNSVVNKKYSSIHIVGGGSQAMYLNELTAKVCQKQVYAGPVEATAIGNIAAQMLSNHELMNLYEVRKCIFDSFEIVKVEGDYYVS